jgi:hypothetical protein
MSLHRDKVRSWKASSELYPTLTVQVENPRGTGDWIPKVLIKHDNAALYLNLDQVIELKGLLVTALKIGKTLQPRYRFRKMSRLRHAGIIDSPVVETVADQKERERLLVVRQPTKSVFDQYEDNEDDEFD